MFFLDLHINLQNQVHFINEKRHQRMANLKESEIALTYESENPFSSEIEIAKKLKKKKSELDRATWGSGLDFLLSGIGYAGKF